MRVDANVSVRPVGTDGARHQGRDQEHELAALARARDRLRDRAPDRACSRPASASCRRRATGTRPRAHARACARKEESNDYRYFPEPDLVPVAPTDEMRAAARAAMPELPGGAPGPARRRVGDRASRTRACSSTTRPRRVRRGRGRALAAAPGKDVANWCTGEVLALPERDRACRPRCCRSRPTGSPSSSAWSPTGTLSRSLAKDVLDECLREPKRPKQVVEERGLAQVSDEGELGAVIDEVLAANADAVERVPRRRRQGAQEEARLPHRSGHEATNRKGNPQLINQLLDDRLE